MRQPLQKPPNLPERLADQLRQSVAARYKPGDKLETVRALCQQYDVSVNTLRAALLILAREGLLEVWQGSGIYVRERVDHRPIGVVMGIDFAGPDVSYFWRRATQQVRLRLAEQGLLSRLYAGFHPPVPAGVAPADQQSLTAVCPEFLDDLAHNRLQGVIVTQYGQQPDWAEPLRERGIPVVGHDSAFENHVTFELTEPVRTATRRLLAAGRRKLAFMDWSSQRPSLASKDELFKAFAVTLAQHGVTFNEQWVRCEFHPNQPGAGWEEFREIWTGSADKPDGLVVTDDVLFHGVARAIGEFGIRVPEQLLVATHSNRGAPEDYPFPLWRIVTDPDAAAQAQVELLLALLRQPAVPPRAITLPVQFVAPDSAAMDRPGQATQRRNS